MSLFLLQVSCGTNLKKEIDEPICKEITLDKGACVTIVTSREFIVDDTHLLNGKTWWELRPYLLAVPAKTWAAVKSLIIKLCKRHNDCEKEVTNWERTIQIIDEKVKE